jgi:hypothetical protein
MDDDDGAQALVERARRYLDTGDHKRASRMLTEAVAARLLAIAAYHAHDPNTRRQARALAVLRCERAGRLGKGRWEGVIRIADLRTRRPSGARGTERPSTVADRGRIPKRR